MCILICWVFLGQVAIQQQGSVAHMYVPFPPLVDHNLVYLPLAFFDIDSCTAALAVGMVHECFIVLL